MTRFDPLPDMSDARSLRRNAGGIMQFEYNLSGKWLERINQIGSPFKRSITLLPMTGGSSSSIAGTAGRSDLASSR
jgi:hypothetical protein